MRIYMKSGVLYCTLQGCSEAVKCVTLQRTSMTGLHRMSSKLKVNYWKFAVKVNLLWDFNAKMQSRMAVALFYFQWLKPKYTLVSSVFWTGLSVLTSMLPHWLWKHSARCEEPNKLPEKTCFLKIFSAYTPIQKRQCTECRNITAN